MVKYIHCSRGHAILVRKANELEVEVTTTDLGTVPTPDGEMQLVKVVATVGTATVWDKNIAKTDTPQKLSLVANSIRATMAVQGKATLQSKILWKVQGQRTTVAKQILKKKAFPQPQDKEGASDTGYTLMHRCDEDRGDAHPAACDRVANAT